MLQDMNTKVSQVSTCALPRPIPSIFQLLGRAVDVGRIRGHPRRAVDGSCDTEVSHTARRSCAVRNGWPSCFKGALETRAFTSKEHIRNFRENQTISLRHRQHRTWLKMPFDLLVWIYTMCVSSFCGIASRFFSFRIGHLTQCRCSSSSWKTYN